MTTPNYNDIKHALETAHNLITPSELHGILCGLVCAGLQRLDENSLSETLMLGLPEDHDNDTINATLNTLFSETYKKIQEFDMSFQLLLPEDDEVLSERAYEFGKWCEGFMAGFGLSGVPHHYRDQAEVDDILSKISEASRIEFSTLGISEEDEYLFTQVTEFVRLSVLAVYQELSEGSSPDGNSFSGATSTLH